MTLNRSRFTRQTHFCNRKMPKANQLTIPKLLPEHSCGHWLLWKAFNNIMHLCCKVALPDHSYIDALTKQIRLLFIINVNRLLFLLELILGCVEFYTRKTLQNLISVPDDEVHHILLLAWCKSSDINRLPNSLVRVWHSSSNQSIKLSSINQTSINQ